ncbi:hypothetical protein ACFS07_20315 [Undibacterium arcticum]
MAPHLLWLTGQHTGEHGGPIGYAAHSLSEPMTRAEHFGVIVDFYYQPGTSGTDGGGAGGDSAVDGTTQEERQCNAGRTGVIDSQQFAAR